MPVPVIACQSRTRQPGLDTALQAAVTNGSGQLVRAWPRQGVVPPLPCDTIGATDRLAAYHDPATGTGADNHAEHHSCTGRRSIGRLRQRKTISIIGKAQGAAQQRLEVPLHRLAVQADGIGVPDAPAGTGKAARHADTDTAFPTGIGLQFRHQGGDHRHQAPALPGRPLEPSEARQHLVRLLEDSDQTHSRLDRLGE